MSDTKRDPMLLRDSDLVAGITDGIFQPMHPLQVRIIYEAARAKDAELIQRLVDDLRLLRIEFGNRVGQTTEIGIASLSAAEDSGFTPSDSTN